MFKSIFTLRFAIIGLMSVILLTACKKDPKTEITPTTPALRSSISYTSLTAATSYDSLFVNSTGDSTVDRREGQNLLKMLRGIDAYAKKASGTGTSILSEDTLKKMFSNTGNVFTGTYAPLNSTGQQLRSLTASSKNTFEAEKIRADIEGYFSNLAKASDSVTKTASVGKAGKLGTYLVDEKGIEWGQVIAKSLIGALQLDYIGNVLLDGGLNADNANLVSGKNYSQLEHNWDIAYGVLTLKPRYASTASTTSAGGESFLGSYVWEYNKTGYPKLHPAFLKGRAAIVNNDKAELKVQADLIRAEFEKAIASAALGYLGKWKTNPTNDPARAHAIGEGAGFIYSLRFCKVNGADDVFSDSILNDLGLYSGDGFWGLTNAKIVAAENAIKAKFAL